MQLLETIKCLDGALHNLKYHQKRFDQARRELGYLEMINLKEVISIPQEFQDGLFRCRVLYSEHIDNIEFLPHQFKKVESLKLVFGDEIDYHLKFSNRKHLDLLYEKRGRYDDILVVKNGNITDSWTANSIFFDGIRWWTSDTPLLPGTQRARLITEGKIAVCRITINDLSGYQKAGLINAMQDMENMPVIQINNIKF